MTLSFNRIVRINKHMFKYGIKPMGVNLEWYCVDNDKLLFKLRKIEQYDRFTLHKS